MENKPIKVSVIIPVYNVGNYLDRCLNSVLEQTEKNIEILCIDDCSTDDSLSKLESFGRKDKRLHIFKNEINQGQAYSRNIGLDNAQGEFILFVDADDYIEDKMIEEMYAAATKRKLDLLLCDTKTIREDEEIQAAPLRRFREVIYEDATGVLLFHHMVQHRDMFGSVWAALYRTRVLNENCIRFKNGILHEDIPFVFKSIILSSKAGCLNNTYYYYVERNGSTMRSDNIEQRLEGLLSAYFEMLIFWNEHGNNQSIYEYIENYRKFAHYLYSQMDRNKIKNPMVKYIVQTGLIDRTSKNIEIADKELSIIRESRNGTVIYGAGKIAREVFVWLEKNNIHVDAFVVTNLKNNDTEVYGIPVITKNDLLNLWKEAVIVMGVSIQNRDEIYKELISNVNKERIVDIKR